MYSVDTNREYIKVKNKINLQAQSVTVEAGKDHMVKTESHEYKQSGLTVSVSTPLTDLAQSIYQRVERSNQVKSSRLKNLYLVKASYESQSLVSGAKQTLEGLSQLGKLSEMNSRNIAKPSMKLSVSVGSSQSHSSSYTEELYHSASELVGGKVH